MADTYLHRVAIMEVRQVLMDIECENDLDSIKKRAIEAYWNEEGDPEVGLTYPKSVVLYPWLEEGQTAPEGSEYPSPTYMEVFPSDLDSSLSNGCEDDNCGCKESALAPVIPLFDPEHSD